MKKNSNQNIPVKIGISVCLMGEKVRYDAGHKKDSYLTDILGAYFEFVSVCPELEVGMGVPREPVRLVGLADSPRMLGNDTAEDWTVRMLKYSKHKIAGLKAENLSGFILKSNSPSCGIDHVKLFNKEGRVSQTGVGLWANAIMTSNPLLPVEDEERLCNYTFRDNFITRVFAYNRLLNLFSQNFSRNKIRVFHLDHKYFLLSHSSKHYKLLSQLVADMNKDTSAQMRYNYSKLFMEALRVKSTLKKNVKVLHTILRCLRPNLNSSDKAEIINSIDAYDRKMIPLIVPITLLNHYINKLRVEEIQKQYYLRPDPHELMLKNHV